MHSLLIFTSKWKPASAKGHSEKERLHVQDRPKGCLLLCSNVSKTSEVHQVLLGGSVIRISLSMFWPGTSSTNFYKATENCNSDSTKNQHSDYCLSGRYTLDEPNNRRPDTWQRRNQYCRQPTNQNSWAWKQTQST